MVVFYLVECIGIPKESLNTCLYSQSIRDLIIIGSCSADMDTFFQELSNLTERFPGSNIQAMTKNSTKLSFVSFHRGLASCKELLFHYTSAKFEYPEDYHHLNPNNTIPFPVELEV